MDGLIVLFIMVIIFGIVAAAILSNSNDDEDNNSPPKTNAEIVEAFMDEMRKRAFELTVNIEGDLNGTIVLGDVSIKNSYNNIYKTNENLGAAITNLGDHVKNLSKSDEQNKAIFPEFKKLVGAFSLGQSTLIINTWESFLKLYPNIKKDMVEYMFIEKYVEEIRSLSKQGNDGIDSPDDDSSADGGSDGGDCGGGVGDGGGGS